MLAKPCNKVVKIAPEFVMRCCLGFICFYDGNIVI